MRLPPWSVINRITVYSVIITTLLSVFALPALAQTIPASPNNFSTVPYNTPNTDPGVPQNQHIFAQSVMIELFSATICQLTGIDPVMPSQSCLGIDTKTGKLGFAPVTNGTTKLGGALGAATNMISDLYTPTTSTKAYFDYLANNFGIVKKTEAASAPPGTSGTGPTLGYGFTGLQPIMQLWITSRNIAYFLFVLAFMLIGLGIMLRIKIDPRTVMTIQNQIPRIIVCILLITFSYAIAAVMIDAMWLTTYVGINILTSADTAPNNQNFAKNATQSLLYTPVGFAQSIYDGGIGGLALKISGAMGDVVTNIIESALGVNNPSCSIFNLGGCFGALIGFLTNLIMIIIILIALFITLFRVWFDLLKAYVFIIVQVIVAPLWIVMGLLPGRPLGFEKWMRAMFANLATFPAVAAMLVLAKVLIDMYGANGSPDPNTTFIPPLVGDPNMQSFSVLIAFGILMMTPTMLTLMRDIMKVPANKSSGAIASGLAAGAAVPAAIAGKQWANLTRRNSQTGAAEGLVSSLQDKVTKTISTGTVGKLKPLKGLVQQHFEKRDNMHAGYGFHTNNEVSSHHGVKVTTPQQQFREELAKNSGKYSPDKAGFKRFQKDQEQLQKADTLDERAQGREFGGRLANWQARRDRAKANWYRQRVAKRSPNQQKPPATPTPQRTSGPKVPPVTNGAATPPSSNTSATKQKTTPPKE